MRRRSDARSSPSTYSIERKWRPRSRRCRRRGRRSGARPGARCAPRRGSARGAPSSLETRLREELERDGLAELQVVRAVDLAHAAAAEEADDAVAVAEHGVPARRRRGRASPRRRGGRRRRAASGRQLAPGPCPSRWGGAKASRRARHRQPAGRSRTGRNRKPRRCSGAKRVTSPSRWYLNGTRSGLRPRRVPGAGEAPRCAILRRSGGNAGTALWRRRSGSRSGLKRRSIANGPRRQPSERQTRHTQALSSVVEHYLDTVGVSSSILLAPTIRGLSRAAAVRQLEGA